MRVGTVELHDFRSYRLADLTFLPGVNLMIGPNGIGKTNVVEAVGYVSTLSSHRVSSDQPLVRGGSAQAIVRLEVIRGDRSLMTEIAINPGRSNRMQISGSPVPARDFVGQLRSVTFAPEDLALVKGDPADRRRFLDEVLVQRAPRYSGIRADYERIVRQRTALLRSLVATRATGRAEAESTLQVWDEQLAAVGSALLFGRLSLLNELAGLVEQAYEDVAPGSRAQLAYDPRSLRLGQTPAPEVAALATAATSNEETDSLLSRNREQLEQLLNQQIRERRHDELARGVTLVGPHRDDLALRVRGLPAKTHASHGECWSLALALRLGSFELMRSLNDGAGDPVLILDDVFAELDQSRRRALAKVAAGAEQVLVTAAVDEDVPETLTSTRFAVSEGQVSRG